MISNVKFFCAALFGVICGAVTMLCLNSALKAKEGEEKEGEPGVKGKEVQYAESQNHPREHDERFC